MTDSTHTQDIDAAANAPAPDLAPAPEAAPAPAPAAEHVPAEREAGPASAPEVRPGSKMAELLESLSEPDLNAAATEQPAPAPPTKPAADKPVAAEKPAPEADDEALALEGVKSERGRERIKQTFAAKKQLERDIGELRDMVRSSGMSPEEFASSLEFGRLVNAGDERSLRVALEMLERQRATIYGKLGVEAPGVDLLQGHDDLKKAIADMEITRERAVELARLRQREAEERQRWQAAQQSQAQQQQFDQQVRQGVQSIEAYLQTRAHEVDHAPRLAAIEAYFKSPENVQRFVSTYEPRQWPATLQMMYDGVKVPAAARPAAVAQPLRSRPAALGNPAPSGESPMDRIAQRMMDMGI